MNPRTFGILTDTVLLEEKIDMEQVKSIQLPIKHRLRIYSPRFVRFAHVKDYTPMGVIRTGGWMRTHKARRAR